MRAKRFFALMMAVLTVVCVCVMSGCSAGDTQETQTPQEDANSRKLVTLNMYIVTDDKTDSEQAQKVQMELNRILVPGYKTMLKVNYVTKDNYWSELNKTIEQVESYQESGILPEEMQPLENAEKPVDIQTLSFNELIDYIFEAEDVTLTEPQIDLFVVDDYDRYKEMAFNGDLAPLDDYVLNEEKVLSQYLHPTFLSAAKVANTTYGIPTNCKLEGEFTYFVFNKDLLDRFGYKMEDLNDYAKLGEYLQVIKKNVPGVWPVSGTCDIAGAEIYEDSFITINQSFDSVGAGISALFMEPNYVDHLKAVAEYKQKGFYPSQKLSNAKYAVEIVKTDKLLEKEWTENGTEYCAYLYDIPRVTSRQAFKSAMCVSSLSKNPERAMELITMFNTDPELANLLQYGINGENYYLDKDTQTITMLNESYVMDTLHTGNTYIKYQLEGNESYIEDSKQKNNLLAQSAFLGFNPYFDNAEYNSIYNCLVTVSKAAVEKIEKGADVDAIVLDAQRELKALGYGYEADGSTLKGVFGSVAKDYGNLERSFRVADEIKYYNTGMPDARPDKEQQSENVLAALVTEIDGIKMYDLEKVCQELDCTYVALETEGKYIAADGKCIATLDSTRYICDGVPAELETAPVVKDSAVYVPEELVLSIKAIQDAKA